LRFLPTKEREPWWLTMNDVSQRWSKAFLGNYATPQLDLVAGRGSLVFDANKQKYLDFVSGIAVSSLGHSHPAILRAIKKQSKKILHTSNLYSNEPSLQLAEKIQTLSSRKCKIFFCNSGAEANEAALKITRLRKAGITLSLNNSFHGRTLGALSLTGQPSKQAGFEPLVPNINFLAPNSFDEFVTFSESEISSVFFEPIQGEGGVVDLSPGFLAALKSFAVNKNAALVADEVQTGMGRTGHWFLSEALGLNPEVIVLAKGLAGGLPIGAVVVFDELIDIFTPGSHGTTFGGNPLSCAVALAVIETIEKENLLENSKLRGEQFVRNLLGHLEIQKITGSGLLRGIYLNRPIAKQVVAAAQNAGLLLNAISDSVIRVAPPLIVDRYEIDKASEIISESLDAA